MKKLTIILLGLIGVAYGQTMSTLKVSPGITVLVPSDTVGRYIRPIAGTNMTITGIFPNLTFNATASGSGTVTGLSIATVNGFAGTSSGGATPVITLTTPITGVLKGNGTAISAATAGTDYGRVDSVRFQNSGLIHTPMAAFALVGNTAVVTQNLATQTANTVLSGPASGAVALPTFRALVALDIPTLNQSTSGNAATATNLTGLTTTIATLNNQSGINTGDNATNTQYSGLVSNATHTGDATGATALTVVKINGTLMSGLATGILKNTTGTGVPSIAVAGTDYLAPGTVVTTFSGGTTGLTPSSATSGAIALAGTLGIANGGTGVSSVPTVSATSAFAAWDANKNLPANNHINAYTTTVTAAGTTALTASSTYLQFFTGTANQIVTLPANSVQGMQFYIRNNSTGTITINSSAGNLVRIIGPTTRAMVTSLTTSGTTGADWSANYLGGIYADGKTLTISNSLTLNGTDGAVVNVGTGGTMLTAETDPTVKAITGLVKSNGTTISAAVAGTDYVIPSGSITGNAASVTTNANLTGPITSVGNATSIASQTGTGTTFAMATSPSFTTNIITPQVAGSTAAGGNMQLSSTTNATKGKIFIGSGGAYDGVNERLGIGTQSPNDVFEVKAGNGSTSYGGITGITLWNSNTTYPTKFRAGSNYDGTYLTQNAFFNGSTWVSDVGARGAGGIAVNTFNQSTADILFYAGVSGATATPATQRMILTGSNGYLGIGVTAPAEILDISGNLSLRTAGNKLKVATGTNASIGTATLVAGTVTVSTTAALTASLIYVTVKTPGGTQGFLSAPTITNATSFVINSTSATETSVVNWWVIN